MNLDMRYLTEVVAPDRIQRWEEDSERRASSGLVTEDEYRLAKALLSIKASPSEADGEGVIRGVKSCPTKAPASIISSAERNLYIHHNGLYYVFETPPTDTGERK